MLFRTLVLLGCVLACSSVQAVQVDTAWVRTYGSTAPDILMDITVDAAGFIYTTGYVWGGASKDNIAILKYDPDGDTAWARIFDGPASGNDRGNGVAVDVGGNVYVCGMSDTTNGLSDWVVLKYLPDGQLDWRSRIGGFLQREEATDIAIDDSGHVFVTGTNLLGSSVNINTVKYSSAGAILWQESYDGAAHGYDYPHGLALDSAGNAIVCGQTSTGVSGVVYVTLKYNSAGGLQWERTYDSPSLIDMALAVGVDGSDNIYVTGINQPLSGIDVGITTLKYTPSGDTLWAKLYDDPFGAEDYARDLAVDAAGNAYIAASTNGGFLGQQFTVMKYDPDGDTSWVRTFPGAPTQGSDAQAVTVDALGRIYATGTIAQPSPNDQDLLVVSLGPDGSTRWTEQYSSPGANGDIGTEVAVAGPGEVVVGGDFDGGNSTFEDFLTIKYFDWVCGDANGNGFVNISDAVYLLNYIFSSGPAPNPLLAGDANCSGGINISDAVYLINYIFSGGPMPCAACP